MNYSHGISLEVPGQKHFLPCSFPLLWDLRAYNHCQKEQVSFFLHKYSQKCIADTHYAFQAFNLLDSFHSHRAINPKILMFGGRSRVYWVEIHV